MGFRDVYNQLKGMKPLAQSAVKKLSQIAMAPAIKPPMPLAKAGTMGVVSRIGGAGKMAVLKKTIPNPGGMMSKMTIPKIKPRI